MCQYLSDKIRVMSFFSIILVFYIHSGFHDLPHEIHGMSFNYYLQELISGVLGRCAVPLFYAISGYLFFRGVQQSNDIFIKIKKRCKTLIIPYALSALILPLFYIGMSFVPASEDFVNNGDFMEHFNDNAPNVLFQLYIDAGNGAPLAFHLWFLRDLIIIVFLSPLLYLLRAHINRYVLLFLMYILSVLTGMTLPFSAFWFLGGSLFLEKFSVKDIGGGQNIGYDTCLFDSRCFRNNLSI